MVMGVSRWLGYISRILENDSGFAEDFSSTILVPSSLRHLLAI